MQDSSVQTIERDGQTNYDPDSYCLQASSASGPFTAASVVVSEPATAMPSQRQSLALALLLSRGATSVCFSHGFRAATALASPPLSRSSLSRVGSSPAGAPLLNRLVKQYWHNHLQVTVEIALPSSTRVASSKVPPRWPPHAAAVTRRSGCTRGHLCCPA